jgi:hypothetical protein
MNRDEICEERLADRREDRLRALGTRNPRCSASGCEENDPFALTGADPAILCREHLAKTQGRARIEQHHPGGRHNDPLTVPIPGNDHAALSELQAQWPEETLRNPDQSPLLRIAAILRGWLDILQTVIDRGVRWIPPALEGLDEILTDRFGPRWWEELGWDS